MPKSKIKKSSKSKNHQKKAAASSPSPQEINALVALFTQARYTEALILAEEMTVRFPLNGFSWKALGALFKQLGQNLSALGAMQKSAALSPADAEAHYNLGITLMDLGRPGEAESSFRHALKIKPSYVEVHNGLGSALNDLGNLGEAEASYRRALELKSDFADAHYNLGNMLKTRGQLDEAEGCYLQALKLNPNKAEALNNLGLVLNDLGRFKEAELNFRRALDINPGYMDAYTNLGITLKGLGLIDQAEVCYRRILEIKPDSSQAHYNLGFNLMEQGRLDEAESCYRNALEILTDYAEAHSNLGVNLIEQGRLDEAEASCRRALKIKPDYAEANSNLGNALQALGRLDEAEVYHRRALEIKPESAEPYYNLGITLMEQCQFDKAESSFRQALEIKPDFAEAHNNLGAVLLGLIRLREAESCFRRALEIKPDLLKAHVSLGNTLKNLGRLNEAEASFRRALEIKPDLAETRSNLLFFYAYNGLISPDAYLAEARTWELACLSPMDRQVAHNRIFQRSPLAGRRLKVGYVSGDYRLHAVSYFIEQLFIHHDRTRIELFAYSTNIQHDEVTERLETVAENWISLAGMSDSQALDRIKSDNIDVLVDLSGHTGYNRLGVFARRAAPVQTHYLGYFGSTGLTEMDYWIGDEILTPPETDSHFCEQVWRLPRVWVTYDGKANVPVSGWKSSQDGSLWLGSFNNLAKLTPATLVLWAKVLHALPQGKLLLKTKELSETSNCQRILDFMEHQGILPNRIELQGISVTPDWLAHMAYYDRLDIALDPIGGIGGGTTTCDALWMGVPVIALEGDRMASRMTASMLDVIGHPEWIARSEMEYIDKVVTLSQNVKLREALRSGQRNRMASSPLCDAPKLAESLENAYIKMFERWFDEKN